MYIIKIKEKKKGYGNALKKGIQEAKGKFIIMGDADCSYDFSASMPIYELLNNNSVIYLLAGQIMVKRNN